MPKVIDSPLTREMTRRGLRRNWMAEQLGVRPWTFSRIEAGKQPAPADWYPRAAAILGVDVAVITPEAAEVAA